MEELFNVTAPDEAPDLSEEPAATDNPELPEEPAAPEVTEESDAPELAREDSGVPEAPQEEAAATDAPEVTEQERVVTERVERVKEERVTERERVVTERVEQERERVAEGRPAAEGVEARPVAGGPEAEAAASGPEAARTVGPEAAPTVEPEKKSPPTEAEKLSKKARRAESSVKEYQFAVLRILLLLVVLWALFFKFIGLVRMPSDEMYPRIDAGDMVLYYRLDTDVRAQDVIVISKSAPDDEEPRLYVLRVVAAHGDTVEISDSDRLVINGSNMVETNIFYPTPRYEGFVDYPLTLGEDECFVLADSRNGGSDSRYFGPVRRDEILGTVITILRRNNL